MPFILAHAQAHCCKGTVAFERYFRESVALGSTKAQCEARCEADSGCAFISHSHVFKACALCSGCSTDETDPKGAKYDSFRKVNESTRANHAAARRVDKAGKPARPRLGTAGIDRLAFVLLGAERGCRGDGAVTTASVSGCDECKLLCAESLSCSAFECGPGAACRLWVGTPAPTDVSAAVLAHFECWVRPRLGNTTELLLARPEYAVHQWTAEGSTGHERAAEGLSAVAELSMRCSSSDRPRSLRMPAWSTLLHECGRWRRFQYPRMQLDFVVRTPHAAAAAAATTVATAPDVATAAATAGGWCEVAELAFPQGHAHRVWTSTLDRFGDELAVGYPGFWRPYSWDTSADASVGVQPALSDASQTRSGHDVLSSMRIVYVANATASPNGHVCDGLRCFGGPLATGNPSQPALDPIERAPCRAVRFIKGHVMVLKQGSPGFGHLFSQMLPQAAMLVESAQRMRPGHALSLLLQERSPSVLSLLREALANATALLHSTKGEYLTASSASILVAPIGTNPIENVYAYGGLRRAHARLFWPVTARGAQALAAAAEAPSLCDTLVYLTRPAKYGMWGRNVLNERSLLVRVEKWLKLAFTVEAVDPSHRPLHEMRALMARARVVMGPHGSAWTNAFFAPLHRADVHLIEFNWLRGRGFFPRLIHYAAGAAHFWTVEPQRDDVMNLPARPFIGLDATSYNRAFYVDEDAVHTVLWHAGVALCVRPDANMGAPPSWLLPPENGGPPVAIVVPPRNSSYRCQP